MTTEQPNDRRVKARTKPQAEKPKPRVKAEDKTVSKVETVPKKKAAKKAAAK